MRIRWWVMLVVWMMAVVGMGIAFTIASYKESVAHKGVVEARREVEGLREELTRVQVKDTINYNVLFEDYQVMVKAEAQRQLTEGESQCVDGAFIRPVADGTIYEQRVQQCGVWKISPVGEMRRMKPGEKP